MIYDTVDFLFLSGWKKCFTKRRDKYGSSVFKINLFMKTIAILDHDGFDPLFSWDGRLKKDYGFGWAVPPASLVGDIVPSVFQANPEHEKYKKHGDLIIHWLPKQKNLVKTEVLMPDKKLIKGIAEPMVKKLSVNDVIQFTRFGFCRLDKKEKNKLSFWFTHK